MTRIAGMMLRVVCCAILLCASLVAAQNGTAAQAAAAPAAITADPVPAGGMAAWGLPLLWAALPRTAALIHEALAHLGSPYRWAGIGRGGFDCSGLVSRVFAAAGVALPHSSSEQYGAGTAVPAARLVPGDLVFFRTYTSGPSHVGIYLGGNRFIHASASRGVVVSSMDEPYFRARFLGARRY
ncbi:MAG TPA: C40 family peptidase [bacterium]|nr:C40 family peptidase [bacterium]